MLGSSKGLLSGKPKKGDRERSKSSTGSSGGVVNSVSLAAGAVGGLAAYCALRFPVHLALSDDMLCRKVWRKSTKAIGGNSSSTTRKESESDSGEEKEDKKEEKKEKPLPMISAGSSGVIADAEGSQSNKEPRITITVTPNKKKEKEKDRDKPHRRSSSLSHSRENDNSEDSEKSQISASSDRMTSAPPAPLAPAPITRLRIVVTPPTFKGVKYEPVEDLKETGDLDADKDDLEMAVLSARFRKHQGAIVCILYLTVVE